MQEIRNAYTILVRKPEENRTLLGSIKGRKFLDCLRIDYLQPTSLRR